MDSPKFSLNTTDIYKILRGLMLGIAGFVIAYIGSVYLDISYVVTLGGHTFDFTSVATVAIGSMLEAGRRFLAGYNK